MVEVAGDAAVLVNPESVEDLAGALRQVLSDEQLRQELRAGGPARSRQFTWERTARETVAVYRRFARAS
jgi:glycosyltransferase involved in cell wall biosynthesis